MTTNLDNNVIYGPFRLPRSKGVGFVEKVTEVLEKLRRQQTLSTACNIMIFIELEFHHKCIEYCCTH